jgi:hypothetical protein
MGYKSEVNIYIEETKENGIILEDIIYKSNLAEKLPSNYFEIKKNTSENRVLHFKHENINWNKENPLYKFWTFLINQLKKENYLLIKEEESFDDCEIKGEYADTNPYIEDGIFFGIEINGLDFLRKD